jgi:hypothetical protein
MALRIATFDNRSGGNTLYKALAHPCAAAPGRALADLLARAGPVAVYDPVGCAQSFAEFFSLDGVEITGIYVQDIAKIGTRILGHAAAPATEIANSSAHAVFVAAFDAERPIEHIRPYLPQGAELFSLDRIKIPENRLTNRRHYLDPLNFVTNFALFRDAGGLHTRLSGVNYWPGYGAGAVTCWMTLFSGAGEVIAEWCGEFGAGPRSIVLDSREIRVRFGLGDFAGQLFLQIVGAAGHDVVKYALDVFGGGEPADGDPSLSSTHDANAWPADRYAGLPAPAAGEQVLLWVQNSHGMAIPPGAIGLAAMGDDRVTALPGSVAPFATRIVDVAEVLPGLAWPAQLEVHAGKHVVRPRYEVVAAGRRHIAHVNVEREDLGPDPLLPGLAGLIGKGYLLPAPILPRRDWHTELLPTPMAYRQSELPIAALVYDPDGTEIARVPLGCLPRAHRTALDLDAVAGIEALREGYGHVELVYDFTAGEAADGWLHALFRYRHRHSAHAAETSFGTHIFNTALVYRNEPQSYAGRPPGLSTRLFLRLGESGYDTLCHLIYPASRPWHRASTTEILLYDGDGNEVARTALSIPCSGSRLWHYHAGFDAASRARAGAGAYAIIRDTTCRLFGYHGLVGRGGAFSLDHMFGF